MRSARNRAWPVIPVVLGAMILAACERSAPRGSQALERDSAGVRIVENIGDAPPAIWTIAREPAAVIGVEDGDSMHLLFRVRGAVAIGENEIVIANGAPPMLRWFDRDGQFLRGTGRTGAGPGEFQGMEGGAGNITALWPLGEDSIGTWEHPFRRMQVFSPSGEYVHSVVLELPADMHPAAYPQIVGRVGNDGFVAYISMFGEPRNTSGTWRDSLTFARWMSDGTYADTVAFLPGIESQNSEFMGRRSRGRVPFGKPMAVWADSTGFYYGSGDRFEISAYHPSGELRMIVRRDAPLRPITDEDEEEYIQEQMRGAPEEPEVRRAWEVTLRAAPFPDSLPAYRRIRTDRLGNLWVQEFDLPNEPEITWHVFDSRGLWLSIVRVPENWQIQDIGRDYILVITTNEMDVEVVQLFELHRSSIDESS